jgi:hypothetical protein
MNIEELVELKQEPGFVPGGITYMKSEHVLKRIKRKDEKFEFAAK